MSRRLRPTVRQMPRIYGNLQRERKDYRPLIRRIKLTFFGFVAVCILYLFFFSSVFAVKKVEVQGAVLSNQDAIAAIVPVGGSIWRIDDLAIRTKVLESQPVQRVTVLKGLPDSIRVVVEEQVAVALWKSGTIISLLDQNGTAFFQYSAASLPTGDSEAAKKIAGLPIITDTKNIAVTLGTQIVSTNFIDFITATGKAFQQYAPDHKITELSVADTTYDLTLKTDKGLTVLMNTVADAAPQVRNVARLFSQKKVSQNATIDLRIDRWAYVKNQ